MSMDLGGGKKGPRSDINVTPLIDVVLVLLIIFMVLTPSLLKHVRVTVPNQAEDGSTPPSDDEIPIVVECTAKGDVMVNTEPVPPEALADRLTERLRADRRKVVFFKAEDAAPYGKVVRLMDMARAAGARTLAVVTK